MSLKQVILAALSHQSATGYELAQSFDQSLSYFWQASHQQIYKDLSSLEALGDIKYEVVPQSGKPERKVYEITDQGRQSLTEWICNESSPPPIRDNLLVKLYAGHVVSPDVIIQALQSQLALHQERLKTYQGIEDTYFKKPESLTYSQRLIWLTLKQGLMYEAQRLEWLKLAISELSRAKNSA